MKQQQSGSLPKEFPQHDKHKGNENQNQGATGFQNISLNQRLYIEVKEKERGTQCLDLEITLGKSCTNLIVLSDLPQFPDIAQPKL